MIKTTSQLVRDTEIYAEIEKHSEGIARVFSLTRIRRRSLYLCPVNMLSTCKCLQTSELICKILAHGNELDAKTVKQSR